MKLSSTFKLLLLSSPAMIGGFCLSLLSADSAHSADINTDFNSITIEVEPAPMANLDCDRSNCTGNNYLASFPQVTQEDGSLNQFPNVQQDDQGHLLLNVTEEESDTAVKMFGCDCVKAINALRQARGIPIGVEGDRILPGPLIRPCTQVLPSA